MTNFEKNIVGWLEYNNFDVGVMFEEDFGYDRESNTLHIGTLAYEDVCRWFEQYLYEFGMEYTGVYDPVLCLLHELGHYKTIDDFSEEELMVYDFAKNMLDDRMEIQEVMNKYWDSPDEFAANMWVVNYVNLHIDAVEALCEIYWKYWNEFVEENN